MSILAQLRATAFALQLRVTRVIYLTIIPVAALVVDKTQISLTERDYARLIPED